MTTAGLREVPDRGMTETVMWPRLSGSFIWGTDWFHVASLGGNEWTSQCTVEEEGSQKTVFAESNCSDFHRNLVGGTSAPARAAGMLPQIRDQAERRKSKLAVAKLAPSQHVHHRGWQHGFDGGPSDS